MSSAPVVPAQVQVPATIGAPIVLDFLQLRRGGLPRGKSDIDQTLAGFYTAVLDELVPTILSALRIAGLDLHEAAAETEADAGAPKPAKVKIEGSIADLLAAGLLAAGTKLQASRGARSTVAMVNAKGELTVDGVAYLAPSTAAMVGLGVASSNGWTAWSVAPDGPSLSALREQLPAKYAADGDA